jgi:hypothetical protein
MFSARIGAIFFLLWAPLIGSHSYGGEKKRQKGTKMTEQLRIANQKDAIDQSARLTALNLLTNKVSAERIIVADERTPYLWKQFANQPAWKVEYFDVRLELATSMKDFADPYRRTFTVLLNEKTGQLINIVSKIVPTTENHDGDLLEQPSGKDAEAQLAAEDEIYHGLPTEPPKLNFLDALAVVLNKGIGSPFLAKQIYANFVMHSRGGSPVRSAWVVTLRGIPPIAAHGPHGDSIPVWQRNHIRNVVDDETGKNLFATNSPQPRP